MTPILGALVVFSGYEGTEKGKCDRGVKHNKFRHKRKEDKDFGREKINRNTTIYNL